MSDNSQKQDPLSADSHGLTKNPKVLAQLRRIYTDDQIAALDNVYANIGYPGRGQVLTPNDLKLFNQIVDLDIDQLRDLRQCLEERVAEDAAEKRRIAEKLRGTGCSISGWSYEEEDRLSDLESVMSAKSQHRHLLDTTSHGLIKNPEVLARLQLLFTDAEITALDYVVSHFDTSPSIWRALTRDDERILNQIANLTTEQLKDLRQRFDERIAAVAAKNMREIEEETQRLLEFEQQELEEEQHLRDLNLGPLEKCLFVSLMAELENHDFPSEAEQEAGLAEWELVEIVYRVWWHELDGKKQDRLKARLRVLRHALNNKLLLAKSPFRVVRLQTNRLVLQDSSQPVIASAGDQQLQPKILLSVSDALPTSASILAKCIALVEDYLADGARDSTALKQYCEAQGHSSATIRRAKKKLGVITFRTANYGANGKWMVRLPRQSEAS
jgi:hypothetical protein